MSAKIAIHEGARVAPVGVGWAALTSADPTTQVTLVAGVLTCIYLIAQLWLIMRRARIEREKLEMAKAEHRNTLDKHQAEMDRLASARGEGGGDS